MGLSPVGDPIFFDIPAVLQTVDWLMTTATPADFEQWQSGENAAEWANRVHRILAFVEDKQRNRNTFRFGPGPCQSLTEWADSLPRYEPHITVEARDLGDDSG